VSASPALGPCGGALAFAGAVAFSALYFGFAAAAWFLTRTLLPRAGIGAIVDFHPLREEQIHREIRRSIVSIFLFGGYGLLVFEAWRAGRPDRQRLTEARSEHLQLRDSAQSRNEEQRNHTHEQEISALMP
jgi:hypothetical protein